MKAQRWMLAWLASFVVLTALEMFFHHRVLGEMYRAYAQFWRPEAEMRSLVPFFWIGNAIYTLAFTQIFTKGYEGKGPLGEGVRYGAWIWLLTAVPKGLIHHAIMPYPTTLTVAWVGIGLIEALVLGVVVATICAPGLKPAR